MGKKSGATARTTATESKPKGKGYVKRQKGRAARVGKLAAALKKDLHRAPDQWGVDARLLAEQIGTLAAALVSNALDQAPADFELPRVTAGSRARARSGLVPGCQVQLREEVRGLYREEFAEHGIEFGTTAIGELVKIDDEVKTRAFVRFGDTIKHYFPIKHLKPVVAEGGEGGESTSEGAS